VNRGFLERPDCRLYYEVAGSGPAIVFAHGLGGNHMSWWQQVPHFRDRHTCVTFSHRGFAPSTAPAGGPDPKEYTGDLAALIGHLKLDNVRLVAQSMGGWSSLDYAIENPAKVRALVLASTAGTIAREPGLFKTPDQMSEWSKKAAATMADLRARNIHVAGGARLAAEQPAAHYLYQAIDNLSAGLDKEFVRAKLGAGLTRSPNDLRTLNVPTLWLTGAEDIVYPPFLSDALAALMPNAEVRQIAASGHSMYFERPAEFNALIDAFLARNP
jgi:pimeloyl-ACP methyl ester carboxylesterase